MPPTPTAHRPAPEPHQRVLVTVTGHDREGITATLTSIIADAAVDIVDMEQVVVQGILSLSIVLAFPAGQGRGQPVLKELLFAAKELGLALDFEVLAGAQAEARRCRTRSVLTLIGNPDLRPQVIARIARVLADAGFNIETIQWLHQDRTHGLELVVSSPARNVARELKPLLLPVAREFEVDLALQPDTLFRMMKRLVVFDLDSTLIQMEIIDELARCAGVHDEVCAITELAMNGQLDFAASLRRRVALLEGLEEARLAEISADLPLTPGAEGLIGALKQLGYRTAVISGGFSYFADRVKARLGLDYAYANTLELRDGRLTGRVLPPVIDGEAKAELLVRIASDEHIRLEQVIAIGDGANDLPMLAKAGLGIAFNAKPRVRDAAEHSLNQHRLDTILFLLGITQDDLAALAPTR
ncbi:MAG: phosphoserine phosphatase SerB [Candidatus Lambdaproteobacteria bacterium]|nr:phosphoserine phosphatase SerB [Candidatus Lambdaproteobacteria bacterium]